MSYYEVEDALLYNGDTLSILPHLKLKYDLIFANPPFNLNKDFEDQMTSEEYYDWCAKWIKESWKLVSDTGSFFLMTIQEHVGKMMECLEQGGCFRNQIIWLNSSMPVKNKFCVSYQPILWYVKDPGNYVFNYGAEQRHSTAALPWGRKNTAHSIRDIWDDIPFISGGCMASSEAILVTGSKKKSHSAQMPLRLSDRIIKYCTNPGQSILDLFSGSGTCLLSAKKLDRKCTGIERNSNYCELIVNRLQSKYDQQDNRKPEKKMTDLFD